MLPWRPEPSGICRRRPPCVVDTVASDHNRQWADAHVPYGTGTTVRWRTLQGCGGPVQMLHYALHCIASLPSSASDTPVPPLGLFYLRSTAVVAGLELQVLVPTGPAPGLAAPTASLASQPSPAQPSPSHRIASHRHSTRSMPANKSPLHRPSHLVCVYSTPPEPPRLSLFRQTTARTISSTVVETALTARQSKPQHAALQSKITGRRPSFRDAPLAPSWETRKCDQGPCMCPITRGFPAISLSMIPSSGDRRSSLPVPSTPSQQQQGAWGLGGPRAATKSQPLHAMGGRDRRQTPTCRLSTWVRCRATRGTHHLSSRSPQQSDPRKPVATCGLCVHCISNENDRNQATMCGLLTLGRRVATIFSSF